MYRHVCDLHVTSSYRCCLTETTIKVNGMADTCWLWWSPPCWFSRFLQVLFMCRCLHDIFNGHKFLLDFQFTNRSPEAEDSFYCLGSTWRTGLKSQHTSSWVNTDYYIYTKIQHVEGGVLIQGKHVYRQLTIFPTVRRKVIFSFFSGVSFSTHEHAGEQ